MKQKHDFGPRERDQSGHAPHQSKGTTWTKPHPHTHWTRITTNSRPPTQRYERKKKRFAKWDDKFLSIIFSLIVRHKPKKLHKIDSSLEKVFPRVLRKCVLFLLRRTRTSSKVRCVLKRVNFARSERIAFLYFSTGRSLLFSREQIFEREYSSITLSERVKHQIRPQYFIAQ